MQNMKPFSSALSCSRVPILQEKAAGLCADTGAVAPLSLRFEMDAAEMTEINRQNGAVHC
jgi:hypothetical protein